MRVAFGLITADTGTITVAGTGRQITSAADAIDAGIRDGPSAFYRYVPAMTVAENVAGSRRQRPTVDDGREPSESSTSRGADSVLDPVRAAELPVGGQQRLEIVKALARNTQTLILDEPTAVLAPAGSR